MHYSISIDACPAYSVIESCIVNIWHRIDHERWLRSITSHLNSDEAGSHIINTLDGRKVHTPGIAREHVA